MEEKIELSVSGLSEISPHPYPKHFMRYLGTAGTRYVMLSQLRASGGIWFDYGGVRAVIDPGPGSLVQISRCFPHLTPMSLRAILLTHRHIDHSTDLSVLCEAMTDAGHKRQGTLITPHDAQKTGDPVVLSYISKQIKNNYLCQDGAVYSLGKGVTAEAVLHRHHGVECYGYIFRCAGLPTWGIISDTSPVEWLVPRYEECAFISVNTTILYPYRALEHFSVPDVASLLGKLSPRLLTMTHLGQILLKNNPSGVAKSLSTPTTHVQAATDGLVIDLQEHSFFQGCFY